MAIATAVAGLASWSPAIALPSMGDVWLPVRLRDAWDRTVELNQISGKATLVVYEDKDSARSNGELKRALAQAADGERFRARATLLAVADVSAYDYWPLRGLVKGSIRDESARQRTNIYCDWDGAFRRTLSLRAGASNIVLYGKNGKALFAQAGALSAEERARALDLLRRETE